MEIIISDDTASAVQQHFLSDTEEKVSITVPERREALVVLHFQSTMRQVSIQSNVGEYASLTLLCVQPADIEQSISQRNTVAEGAKLHCQNITLGAKVEHSIETELQGANAVSSVDWMAYAKGSEQQVLTATNIFNAPNGSGEMTIKSVAEDTARVACTGLIDIGLSGGGTDTYLTEEVLMLDPTCVIDAIPGLEIKTNDVKASHSATVSRVTDADLFYFGARGIPFVQARKMFVLGFLGNLLEGIAQSDIQQSVAQQLEEKYLCGL